MRQVAGRVGATPAQVALAWVLAQGRHVVPIPGTKTPKYLAENAAAADVVLPGQPGRPRYPACAAGHQVLTKGGDKHG